MVGNVPLSKIKFYLEHFFYMVQN